MISLIIIFEFLRIRRNFLFFFKIKGMINLLKLIFQINSENIFQKKLKNDNCISVFIVNNNIYCINVVQSF